MGDSVGNIQIENVRVVFGGVIALDELSLDLVGPGIIGIVGPNGSGKSTLMGVLSGLVRDYSGRVLLDGKDLRRKTSIQIASLGVRRSFQTVRLVENLTIFDNLLIGAKRKEVLQNEEVRQFVADFGLTAYLDKWPREVPAGIQRLTQVAAAMIAGPSIVLLDEPAAGLTDIECAELAEVIRRQASKTMVLLVEHNMDLMFNLAERVVALVNGKVIAIGTPQNIQRNEEFRTVYLGIEAGGNSSNELRTKK